MRGREVEREGQIFEAEQSKMKVKGAEKAGRRGLYCVADSETAKTKRLLCVDEQSGEQLRKQLYHSFVFSTQAISLSDFATL